ncbi:MAG: hypothetical protein OSB63_02015 [Planctomycetota bacterium]|nr:hypothetical protein [Planctomycetota bacterium]
MVIGNWSGKVSVLDGGGFDIVTSDSIILQRIAIHETLMVVISWESPKDKSDDGRECLDSFVIPQSWLASDLVVNDIYHGNSSRGLDSDYPGTLVISVSLANSNTTNLIDIEVAFVGHENAPKFEWQLPDLAINSKAIGGGAISYQLALNTGDDISIPNGIFRLNGNDLTAFDPLWLAIPNFADDVEYRSPAWQLSLEYAPHLIAVSAPMIKVELNESRKLKNSVTQIIPSGSSWPFFAVANYRAREVDDFKWFLRLDSKSKLPDDVIEELLLLDKVLDSQLGAHKTPFTVSSFPYSGDRLFSGLLVFDEQRGWFDSPTDASIDSFSRRVHLARILCEYRFGIESAGRGSAKLFLTRSLAEYLAQQLLEKTGYEDAAKSMSDFWQLNENNSGSLPQALSLTPIYDLYGARRLLSFGSIVWQDIATRLGAKKFNGLCKQIYSKPAYSADDLLKMLLQVAPDNDWRKYFQRHVFGNQLLSSSK